MVKSKGLMMSGEGFAKLLTQRMETCGGLRVVSDELRVIAACGCLKITEAFGKLPSGFWLLTGSLKPAA